MKRNVEFIANSGAESCQTAVGQLQALRCNESSISMQFRNSMTISNTTA